MGTLGELEDGKNKEGLQITLPVSSAWIFYDYNSYM